MNSVNLSYLVYGMSIMFFGTMSFLFWQNRKERFKLIAAVITAVILLQLVKDLFFFKEIYSADLFVNKTISLYDSIIMPAYFFMLYELCRPRQLSLRTIILLEAPFIAIAVVFNITQWNLLYYLGVSCSAIIGFYGAAWTLIQVPKYNKLLKQQYSYQRNINLSWLRAIVISFFAILSFWLFCCSYIGLYSDIIYLLMNLVLWIFICHFLSKHEAAIDVTNLPTDSDNIVSNNHKNDITAELSDKLNDAFQKKFVFLNPELNLKDLARDMGTNRTYLSRYFNNEENKSFFDYVNGYRLRHAEKLLGNTDKTIEVISEESGFNSVSTFRRVFQNAHGCSPSKYRNKLNN